MFQTILKYIDKCLPPDIWSSRDKVLRARVAVFLFLVDLTFTIVPFFLGLMTFFDNSFFNILYTVFSIAFDIALIALIRKSYDIGVVIGAYNFVGSGVFLLNVVMNPTQFSPVLLLWTLIFFITILLFRTWGARIFFVVWNLALTVSYPFLSPEAINSPLMQVSSSYLIISEIFACLVILYVYLSSRSIMQVELDQEIEWQLRNAKLAEISSLTRSMHSLMSRPLASIRKLGLNIAPSAAETTEISMRKIEAEIDELVRISQSFAWMYRAFQAESRYSASSKILVGQLRILLKLKFTESGWEWKEEEDKVEALELSGPIPSLMLLLFSLIVQILDNTPAQTLKFMRMNLEAQENLVHWTFSWPDEGEGRRPQDLFAETARDDVSVGGLRRDLIQDLQVTCEASIQESWEEGIRVLQVSGPWNPPQHPSIVRA